jgi:hypothetical protein
VLLHITFLCEQVFGIKSPVKSLHESSYASSESHESCETGTQGAAALKSPVLRSADLEVLRELAMIDDGTGADENKAATKLQQSSFLKVEDEKSYDSESFEVTDDGHASTDKAHESHLNQTDGTHADSPVAKQRYKCQSTPVARAPPVDGIEDIGLFSSDVIHKVCVCVWLCVCVCVFVCDIYNTRKYLYLLLDQHILWCCKYHKHTHTHTHTHTQHAQQAVTSITFPQMELQRRVKFPKV